MVLAYVLVVVGINKNTFLVVEEAIVPHENPVVVEGGGRPTDVEHSRVLLQNRLKLFEMSRISLKENGKQDTH